ncbi:MAG: CDP-alcohol phosphatidyltransferase family protein [Candidatus Limnocylindrales bacterium]
MSGSLVSPDLRARVRGAAEPVARAFGRVGLTPNHLTLIGFGIAIIAAIAAARQSWLAAGLLVIFGGVFDLFDGALARATGQASRFGAFMDSVFDRWGEGVVYIGIAWGAAAAGFNEGAILATAALASAVMVSYARAKSESLGFTPGTGMASVGLAPREIRLVILTVGLVMLGVTGGVVDFPAACALKGDGCDLDDGSALTNNLVLVGTLALITILATITTIQRILHVRNQAMREDQAAG